MRLLLIRHAEALPGVPDELRPLSPNGRVMARQLGEQLAADGIDAAVVLTSPLLRARETGNAIAAALGCASEPVEALAPGATAESVRAVVADRGDIVIAVGHQPDCGRIAAALGDGIEPAFPPAGLADLRVEPGP